MGFLGGGLISSLPWEARTTRGLSKGSVNSSAREKRLHPCCLCCPPATCTPSAGAALELLRSSSSGGVSRKRTLPEPALSCPLALMRVWAAPALPEHPWLSAWICGAWSTPDPSCAPPRLGPGHRDCAGAAEYSCPQDEGISRADKRTVFIQVPRTSSC